MLSRTPFPFVPKSKILAIGLILLVILAIPTRSTNADSLPPGTMFFHLNFHVENISIIDSKLFLCEDAICNHYAPYTGDFSCNNNECRASPSIDGSALTYNKYYKIRITFSDKVRESNSFKSDAMQYDIQIEKDNLSINKNISEYIPTPLEVVFFCIAGFFTILLETIVAAIYGKVIKKEFLPVLAIQANAISLPIVWFVLRPIISDYRIYSIISELFAVIFEASFMAYFGRKQGFTVKHASILSFLMNGASFLAGVGINYWFSHL